MIAHVFKFCTNIKVSLSSDLTNCWLSGKSLEDWLEKVSAGGCKKYSKCYKRIKFCWKRNFQIDQSAFRWISRKSWLQIGKNIESRSFQFASEEFPAHCRLKKFPYHLLAQESAFSEVKGQSVLGEVSETIATWKDGLGIKLEVKKLLAFSCVLKCWTFVFITRTLVYTGWHRRTVESGSLTFLPFSFKYWDNT